MFLRRCIGTLTFVGCLFGQSAFSQNQTIIPNSSLPDASNPHLGVTPLRVLKMNTRIQNASQGVPAGSSGPDAGSETPASVACFYAMTNQVPGCPIAGTTALPVGNPSSIAIVDAYNDPNAASDLATFSQQFGLPSANLTIVAGTPGGNPGPDPTGGGWNLETSLDLQWAHAMNPQASLILIQANSQSDSDMCRAVQTAYQLSAKFVSLSVMYPANDTSWNGCFSINYQTSPATGPVYIAAAGDDTFGIHYPAASQAVIAAGGTRFIRNGSALSEVFWDDGNGTGGSAGLASTESRPTDQDPVQNIVGNQRGIPDFSAIGYGVAIYDSNALNGSVPYWLTVEGTSISAPVIAGRLSGIGSYGLGSIKALTPLYAAYGTASYSQLFRDVVGNDSPCVSGYDLCTGLGTLIGNPVGGTSTPSLYFQDFYQKSPYRTPQTLNLTVSNPANSSGPLTVTGVGISADPNSRNIWTVGTNNCSAAVLPGGSCTIAITRNPAGVADNSTTTFTGSVVVSTSGVNTPLITRMSCTGHG